MLELRVCGGVEVEVDGQVLPESLVGGRQGRLVLAYLACERDRAVRREELAELLWPDQLPESWTASLSAVISRLRRLFTEAGQDGSSVVVSVPGAYQLVLPAGSRVDLEDLVAAVGEAEEAAAVGEADRALAAALGADAVAARGFLADDCEWVDARRDAIRDLRVRILIVQSAAHLAVGASARAIEAARRAVDLDDAKEAAYRQLMVALAAAGERAEALRVWERCRIALVEELGVDPSPETEAIYLGLLDTSPPAPIPAQLPSGVVTFLLTDIIESSALWEDHAAAMAAALERHDAIVAAVVAAHGGALLKSKLEGDATVSVFARATECAAAALALIDAIESEPWPEGAHPRLRMAMHTGEAFERDGDYFGPALNRAARLRSLAAANEVLLSQAVAELVRDHVPDGVALRDRGLQRLRGLSRGENVFELTRAPVRERRETPVAEDLDRPPVPAALAGTGPFVGRGDALDQLAGWWRRATAGERGAVFVGGEPGVGKSRLAGAIAHQVHADGGFVLYGRCDEDLAAPLQPFIEAVRVLAPALGATRLRAVRGIDELTRVVPELTELLGEKPEVRADPDTERLALFDAVTQLFVAASNDVPVLIVLDDLHWAGKTTLSLLRHLLRGAKGSRLLMIGTYRDTELARTHPLAESLADLRRDTDTHRITLGGLAEADVAEYLAAIGNTDRALGHALAEVTAGNPFFLIEVVRHVEESGGTWQPGSLPEGVREATGRRLSRLSEAANDALAVAAVAGTTFDLALVEQVRGVELVDPIAEAVQAGLVVEEPGSLARFRFAHAIVRQVLLSELVSLKRVRLHRAIAELLEAAPPAADAAADARLADLAYHWFECAAAGSADKAVDACRRAADRAMERLAYEEAADLYGMALQALEWTDGTETDGSDTEAELHLARCDALLTAGDVAGASAAIDALELAATGSKRLAAWYTTYEGLLAVLGEPDRLNEIVQSIGAAAGAMRDVGDLTGEAKARYVHASALERLGQIGAAERALDAALAAARSAGDRRLADAILAEAPPAALWGPSPVTRASGRCLDVVRVLRITSGTPAVEAVALRCQAVLEALRGRMDAARRLIASSRRTVEQLGLTHRRLETELAAGIIELLDGDATGAEELLRAAYEGLRDRGLGGEAAQAAAFLGRALLLQDRVDEGDDAAAAAEALAGSDLKAAITWRDVRAEASSRRGDTDRALALAGEAVDLASATDALLLVADARLTLAGVLRARGEHAAADAEARRAVEACETKGATVLAELARDAIGVTADAAPARPSVTAPAGEGPKPNLATATMFRRQEMFNRADWDALRASRTDTWRNEDRRPLVGVMSFGDGVMESGEFALAGGGQLDPPELLATRGDLVALARTVLRAPGMEVPFLALIRVEPDGRAAEYVMFEPEQIDDAFAALDDMVATNAFENDATRTAARYEAAFNARDWDAAVACYADRYNIEERRSLIRVSLDGAQLIESMRFVFDGGGNIETEILGTRGRNVCLARVTLRVPAHEATATVLCASTFDTEGRYERTITFEPDDLDSAYEELDRMFLEGEGAEHADVLALGASLLDGLARLDAVAVGELLAPEFRFGDHRSLAKSEAGKDEWLATFGELADLYVSLGRSRLTVEHITGLSSGGGLWAVNGAGRLADAGEFEVPLLLALRVAGGLVTRVDFFDEHDVDAARTAAAPPRGRDAAQFENDATRASARILGLFRAGDWEALTAIWADEYTLDDRRTGVRVTLDAQQSRESNRIIFAGHPDFEWTPLATRGRSLGLSRWTLLISEPEATETVLTVNRVDAAGRLLHAVNLDADDIDGAYAELDRQFLESEGAEHSEVIELVASLFDALRRRDAVAAKATLGPDFVAREHGPVAAPDLAADEWIRNLLETLGVFGSVAVRVEHISDLSRDGGLWAMLTHGEHTDGGTFELPWLMAVRVVNGRIARIDSWEPIDVGEARSLLAEQRHSPDDLVASWIENDAWRAVQRWTDAASRRAWHALTEVLDPEFVYQETRHGSRLRLEGDEALDTYRILLALDECRADSELLATRGERLALTRARIWFVDGAAGPSEVETVSIHECGPDGRIVKVTGFEPEDETAALDALDARHAEQGGSDPGPVRRTFDDRDWEGFASVFTPDCTIVDQRTAGWGEIDRETFVDFERSLVELAPDARLRLDHVRTRGNVTMSVGRHLGTREGAPWEIAFATIGVATPAGARHFESYELNDMALALQRFDELATEHNEEPTVGTAIPRNRAARAVAKEGWKLLSALDENLCLHETPDGFILHEVDESAVVVDCVEYSSDELGAAASEISRRLYRGRVPYALPDMTTALNAHDVDAARRCIADDCVFEDHQKVRIVELRTPDEHLEAMRSVMSIAPDYAILTRRVYAIEEWGQVLLTGAIGSTVGGGPFEQRVIAVGTWDRDGLSTYIGVYDPEDVDAALADLCSRRPDTAR